MSEKKFITCPRCKKLTIEVKTSEVTERGYLTELFNCTNCEYKITREFAEGYFDKDINKDCYNCKWNGSPINNRPCFSCNGDLSNWEAEDE
jgi:transposase-like protein